MLCCFSLLFSLGDVLGSGNVRLAPFGLLWLSFCGRRRVVLFFVVRFLSVLSRVPLAVCLLSAVVFPWLLCPALFFGVPGWSRVACSLLAPLPEKTQESLSHLFSDPSPYGAQLGP